MALAAVCAAPAVASANDEATVTNDGIGIIGDSANNQIRYTPGVNNGTLNYLAEIWDENPSESWTVGAGCVAGTDLQNGSVDYPVVFCGSSGANATNVPNTILIDGGAGDDNIQEVLGSFAVQYSRPFTSIGVEGGDGNDTVGFEDSGFKLSVDGGDGNDKLTYAQGNPGDQVEIDGGSGDDTIRIGPGIAHGDDGNDNVTGIGSDQVYGDAGNDTVTGLNKNVTVDGGSGTDQLVDGTGGLVLFSSIVFRAQDGEKDTVTCYAGSNDVVYADAIDVINTPNCTQVHLSGSSRPAAKLSLSIPAHQKPIAAGKLLATVGCSAGCYMGAYADIKVGSAKPFEVDSNVFKLASAGSKTIPLKFSRKQLHKLKAALSAHKRISARIFAVLANDAKDDKTLATIKKSLGITG